MQNRSLGLWKSPRVPCDDQLMEKSDFTFIDLFAGIGGFHLGLAKNGGKCVYVNEWDKFSHLTYESWFQPSQLIEETYGLLM